MPNATDDYYGGGPDMAGEAKPSQTKPDDKGEMDADSALLPKSLFGGKLPEVGDECRFKVEHIFEDQVEVSYVKDGMDEKVKGKSTMDTATDAFDQMAAPTDDSAPES